MLWDSRCGHPCDVHEGMVQFVFSRPQDAIRLSPAARGGTAAAGWWQHVHRPSGTSPCTARTFSHLSQITNAGAFPTPSMLVLRFVNVPSCRVFQALWWVWGAWALELRVRSPGAQCGEARGARPWDGGASGGRCWAAVARAVCGRLRMGRRLCGSVVLARRTRTVRS